MSKYILIYLYKSTRKYDILGNIDSFKTRTLKKLYTIQRNTWNSIFYLQSRYKLTNPALFSYNSPINLDYCKSTAVVVTGEGNRYDPSFQKARELGAEVYAYLHVFNLPDNITHPVRNAFYGVGNAAANLWGNDSFGVPRSNWPGTRLLDTRKDSDWSDWVVKYYTAFLADQRFDGVFLDTFGCRLWNKTLGWDNLPQQERTDWTNGALDLGRRLDEVRRQINPFSKIIHNNIWHLAPEGERYCDGVCIELPTPLLSLFHTSIAGHNFGDLGQRRVLVVAKTQQEAVSWASVAGVTHVTYGSNYASAVAPCVGYSDLKVPEYKAKISYLLGRVAGLEVEVEDQKDTIQVLETDLSGVSANVLIQQKRAEAAEGVIQKVKDIVTDG